MLQNNSSKASRILKVGGLGLAILFLTGCAFAPGSYVDRDKASEELEGQVAFHDITPELIAQQPLNAKVPA